MKGWDGEAFDRWLTTEPEDPGMEYPIITICGSMRYYDKMLEVAQKVTDLGYVVLMPFVKKGEGSTDTQMLDDMHKYKIDMSGGIIVVGSHIGESTSSEIEYAEKTGKKVTYWTEHFGPWCYAMNIKPIDRRTCPVCQTVYSAKGWHLCLGKGK